MSPSGELFCERMIPVRIMATHREMEEIAEMTIVYYDQLAVMYYRVSDQVVIRHRKELA